MPRDRFVRPEVVMLPLSDGDWISVKRRLTAGEERDAFERMYVAGVDGELKVNPHQVGLSMMLAYLVDWSFEQNGERVPIKQLPVEDVQSALRALDPESFTEIKTAIEAHDHREAARRAEEKKTRDGATASLPISSSPGAAAGVTNGSEISTPRSTEFSARN